MTMKWRRRTNAFAISPIGRALASPIVGSTPGRQHAVQTNRPEITAPTTRPGLHAPSASWPRRGVTWLATSAYAFGPPGHDEGTVRRIQRPIGANGASFIRLLRCATRYPASAPFCMKTCHSGSAIIAARFAARSAASL